MALPPLNFQQPPQPRRSVIEEALGQALVIGASELIQAPFQRRRADEAARRELANLPAKMELEFGDFRRRLREQEAVSRESIVPTLMERVRGQMAVRDEMGKVNVTPGAEAALDIARSNIGGFTPGQLAAPTSLTEFEELKDVLGNVIQSGQLETERERNRIAKEQTRDIRLANLYAPLTQADITEMGNVVNSETGELLSYRDMQLLKTGEARLAQVPEAAGDLVRLREIDALRKAGKLQSIQLNQDAFKKVLQDFRGMDAGPLMTMFGRTFPFVLYQLDNKRRPRRVDAGNVGELTTYLSSNPDLLEAFAAMRLARDMNDIKNAERATGFRLSSRSLGYLSLIFQSQGVPFEHEDAMIPEEIPEEILRQIGTTRVRATTAPQRTSRDSSANPLDSPSLVSPALGQRGSLFTGLTISSEQQYPEYLSLQEGLQTRLRARTFPGVPYDSTKYREFGQDFVNQHRTPEQAAAWYKSLGVPEDKLYDLLHGDERTKTRILNERLSFALGALQNARDAILVK